LSTLLHVTPSKKKTKAKKQKNTASCLWKQAGRRKKKKSCIPGVEYIHILFIYIAVRNDAKDATTTTAAAAMAVAAAAAPEGNNSSSSKLWRQEQIFIERRRRRGKGGHCACSLVCNHDKTRENWVPKI
jgi:hypothetical protein